MKLLFYPSFCFFPAAFIQPHSSTLLSIQVKERQETNVHLSGASDHLQQAAADVACQRKPAMDADKVLPALPLQMIDKRTDLGSCLAAYLFSSHSVYKHQISYLPH